MPVTRPTDVPGSGAPEDRFREERRVGLVHASRRSLRAAPLIAARKVREITPLALALVTLRSISIGAKFALTLFIARFLGLAPLGLYGIIASAAVMCPVLLGFGVSNNLARDAARSHPAAIIPRLLQYFALLVPAYVGLGAVGAFVFPHEAIWMCLLAALLYFEHLQTDLFIVMTVNGHAFGANVMFFIRFSAWVLIYMPLALFEPSLRSLRVMGLFWLAADVLATLVGVLLTRRWRWRPAARSLPRLPIVLPHRYGSTALYLNDVANTGFQYVDRFIIGIMLSPELLGIYTFFWSIVNATNNLITTVIIQPRRGDLIQVARSSATSFNRSLRRTANSAGQMAVGLSAIILVMMYFAIPYIHRHGLMDHYAILLILCVGLVFRTYYEVIGIAFYAHSRDDITLYSGIVILVMSISLNIALVPVLGVWGASLILLVSYAVGVLARTIIVSRGFRPHPSTIESVPEPS